MRRSDGPLDPLSAEKRSEVMRRVRSSNTALELSVRRALHRQGLRFRLKYPLPGHPDLVFVRARLAVFLDSCFWHGCPRHVRMAHSNKKYWTRKIKGNRDRDGRVRAAYKRSGWSVLRLWEHELKNDFEGAIWTITR